MKELKLKFKEKIIIIDIENDNNLIDEVYETLAGELISELFEKEDIEIIDEERKGERND